MPDNTVMKGWGLNLFEGGLLRKSHSDLLCGSYYGPETPVSDHRATNEGEPRSHRLPEPMTGLPNN